MVEKRMVKEDVDVEEESSWRWVFPSWRFLQGERAPFYTLRNQDCEGEAERAATVLCIISFAWD